MASKRTSHTSDSCDDNVTSTSTKRIKQHHIHGNLEEEQQKEIQHLLFPYVCVFIFILNVPFFLTKFDLTLFCFCSTISASALALRLEPLLRKLVIN